MRFLELLVVGRYALTMEIVENWSTKLAWADCWKNKACCCANGVTLGQEEAERIAVNGPVIKKHLAKCNQDKHVLELLDVDADDESVLSTACTDEHPLGNVCGFLDEGGACALHKLAADGIGDKNFGLKPDACVFYPLRFYTNGDLETEYGVTEDVVGPSLNIIGFDKFSGVGKGKESCMTTGETPFHELMRPTFDRVLGPGIAEGIYEAVEAKLRGETVASMTVQYDERMAHKGHDVPWKPRKCKTCGVKNK